MIISTAIVITIVIIIVIVVAIVSVIVIRVAKKKTADVVLNKLISTEEFGFVYKAGSQTKRRNVFCFLLLVYLNPRLRVEIGTSVFSKPPDEDGPELTHSFQTTHQHERLQSHVSLVI